MPATKNAHIRYQVIDQCLCNTGRRYSFDDLKNAIEEKLMEIDPNSSGISIRTLRDDISFMKSIDGYDAPIESYRDGKYSFYRYTDPKFSINSKPLNATEAEQLKNAIQIFQRFEGGVEFEWLDEIGPKLENFFGLNKKPKKIIGHEHNPEYVGQNFFSTFFNAISNEQVLNIHYKTFKNEEYRFNFHPYFLKQYNNRWFVFGLNEEHNNPHWNIPLDRIVAVEPVKINYQKDTTNWEDYFSDMIGVTRPEGAETERVVLRFSAEQTPYVLTKPIYPYQRKPIFLEDGRADIRLDVILNYELKQRILSFGDSVEVMEPLSLREEIAEIAKNMMKNYK